MLIRPKKWNIANLKNIKKFESIYKNGKKIKTWWYWNQKTEFHQYKRPISIKKFRH